MKQIRSHALLKTVALTSVAALAVGQIKGISTAGEANAAEETNKENLISKASERIKSKPNIIYIVLDDMGFSDLGCYGSEIKTPNIDALAKNGLRYNNFNTCPLSSPTRAALLTGRDNNAVGMGLVSDAVLGKDRPNIQGRISHSAATIAQMLEEHGYGTYGVGKWHVAPVYQMTPAGPFDYWPLNKGFNRYYGFLGGNTDQYHPQLVEGNEVIGDPYKPGYTLNDDITEHAIRYVGSHVSLYPEKPFFLYFCFGTSHSPLQVPESYIRKYDGVYDKGWDKIRQERFERQKKYGIIPQNTKLAPWDSSVKPWDSLTAEQKKLYSRFMQCYAGFVTQADEEVGKLVSYLKKTGQYENTLIILISDNGATKDGGPEGTDSFISTFSGRIPTVKDLMPKYSLIGGPEMQALYPRGWGQVSNTPFQGYKVSTYAGGTRDPLIVSWPSGITDIGKVRTQYVYVTDITPTVLDILNIEAPETYRGFEQMPLHGISFAETFAQRDVPESKKTQYIYMIGNSSIYDNGWKAIGTHTPGTPFEQDQWELYKVSEDYSESTDVAADYPDKLKELKRLFLSEATKYGCLLKEIAIADRFYVPADSAANRKSFKYYPEMEHNNPVAAPPFNTGSFTMTVPVHRAGKRDSGVLLAMGDNMGGFSFYIKDNKLIFYYNVFGKVSRLVSKSDVPVGDSVLQLQFTRTSMDGGNGTLYIDGKKEGEGRIKTTPRLSEEGMDVGRDMQRPASPDYKKNGEFPFTGRFDYVQVDCEPFIPARGPGKGGASQIH